MFNWLSTTLRRVMSSFTRLTVASNPEYQCRGCELLERRLRAESKTTMQMAKLLEIERKNALGLRRYLQTGEPDGRHTRRSDPRRRYDCDDFFGPPGARGTAAHDDEAARAQWDALRLLEVEAEAQLDLWAHEKAFIAEIETQTHGEGLASREAPHGETPRDAEAPTPTLDRGEA